MNFNIILDYLILSAFVSLAVNYIARNIARRKPARVRCAPACRTNRTRRSSQNEPLNTMRSYILGNIRSI